MPKLKRHPEDLPDVLPQTLASQCFCYDLNVALQLLYLTEIHSAGILVFPPRLLSQARISWSLKVRMYLHTGLKSCSPVFITCSQESTH